MRLPIIIAAVLALGLSACAQRSTAPGPAAPALPGPLTARQSSYPDKVAPVAGDKVLITDSEALNAPKQVSLGAIAGLAGAPAWLPAAAPTADNMIIQATGGCSNIAYVDQATCEANSGTWTPPVGAWTSIIDGLINDAGTGTDDLLSASEINTRISSAGAFYQVADGDLDTAAGASAAGNSKLFGTNASGVVGWYDIPVDTDTDDQVASEVGFTPNGSIAATTVQAAVQEVRDEAEPALGNPAANGYVLSSTTTGTRSWVAQSGGTDDFVYLADCSTITNGICVDTDDGAAYYWDGTTVTAVGSGGSVDLTAPGPIGSVTPNTGAFTTLVADGFDFTAPVSGTTGEIGLQEDPDNGSSLVTLKAPASLAADLVFTLPTAYAGAANYALVDDGAGTLSWVDVVLVSEIGATVQAYDADLYDLADGSLSGGKVGTGISAANLTTGTLPDERLSAAVAKYVTAPTTATDACAAGQMAYASGYLYVCIATDTWQRAAMAAW